MCRFGVASQPSSSIDVPKSDSADEMWDVGSNTENKNEPGWDDVETTDNKEAAVAEEVTVLEIETAEEPYNGSSLLAGDVGMKTSSAYGRMLDLGANCLFVVCLLVVNMDF